jgi:hypothetical protein
MNVQTVVRFVMNTDRYSNVIVEIESLNWSDLTRDELMAACAAYYYFSAQFVEAVDIACDFIPRIPSSSNSAKGNATRTTCLPIRA